ERATAVHVLLAAREAPPRPRAAAARGGVRTVEAVGEDRLRHVDLDAADGVDQVLELGEVDEGDVVDLESGELFDRPQRQRRPAELERRVHLARAVARNLDPEVA